MRNALLFAALLSCGSTAWAADNGFYVGASIGQAEAELKEGQLNFDADDTGYKIILGYRIIDWVAVEVNYSDYGDPLDTLFGVDIEASLDAKSVSVLGMLPLGKFDLFGRLGIARLDAELEAVRFGVRDSDESTEALFGFGAQFRPTQNLAIRLEADGVLLDASNDNDDDDWDDFWDDDWDEDDDGDWVTMLSLGVTYKF